MSSCRRTFPNPSASPVDRHKKNTSAFDVCSDARVGAKKRLSSSGWAVTSNTLGGEPMSFVRDLIWRNGLSWLIDSRRIKAKSRGTMTAKILVSINIVREDPTDSLFYYVKICNSLPAMRSLTIRPRFLHLSCYNPNSSFALESCPTLPLTILQITYPTIVIVQTFTSPFNHLAHTLYQIMAKSQSATFAPSSPTDNLVWRASDVYGHRAYRNDRPQEWRDFSSKSGLSWLVPRSQNSFSRAVWVRIPIWQNLYPPIPPSFHLIFP